MYHNLLHRKLGCGGDPFSGLWYTPRFGDFRTYPCGFFCTMPNKTMYHNTNNGTKLLLSATTERLAQAYLAVERCESILFELFTDAAGGTETAEAESRSEAFALLQLEAIGTEKVKDAIFSLIADEVKINLCKENPTEL